MKERRGFRVSARDRKRLDDVTDPGGELAEGHPEFRFVGLVDVAAADLDALDRGRGRDRAGRRPVACSTCDPSKPATTSAGSPASPWAATSRPPGRSDDPPLRDRAPPRFGWQATDLQAAGSARGSAPLDHGAPAQRLPVPARRRARTQHAPYMGVSVTAGMSAFHFDPFELYPDVLTNPNVLVVGEVGSGKSTTVKAFLSRSVAVYGPLRFVAILDPKGEYGPLADSLGHPHGPAAPRRRRPAQPDGPPPRRRPRATPSPARALPPRSSPRSSPGRLEPAEDAVLGWAIQTLARTGRPFALGDVVAAVQRPVRGPGGAVPAQSPRAGPGRRPRSCSPSTSSSAAPCAGMFDGPTTIDVDWAAGPGIAIDLSAVYGDRDTLALVMLAATSWLAAVLQQAGDRRVIQVIDEAWAAVRHGARHFQSSLKLARTYGASTWLLCHRPSDLTAQADDGTADAKIAAGLLADLQTRILLRQPADQLPIAAELFGLAERETELVGQLVRGRALWRLQIAGRGRPRRPHRPRARSCSTPTRRWPPEAAMAADPDRRWTIDDVLDRTDLAALLDEHAHPPAPPGPAGAGTAPSRTTTTTIASVTMHTDARGHQRWRCWSGDETHRGDAIDLVMVTRRPRSRRRHHPPRGPRRTRPRHPSRPGDLPITTVQDRRTLRATPARPARRRLRQHACEQILWTRTGRPVLDWLAHRGLARDHSARQPRRRRPRT